MPLGEPGRGVPHNGRGTITTLPAEAQRTHIGGDAAAEPRA
ncbi:hypothetical protein [Amycolatopsis benzoatilytica]|nr:hypothetical protein [Amycolatopsis benzoatilytica]